MPTVVYVDVVGDGFIVQRDLKAIEYIMIHFCYNTTHNADVFWHICGLVFKVFEKMEKVRNEKKSYFSKLESWTSLHVKSEKKRPKKSI